MTFYSILVSVV